MVKRPSITKTRAVPRVLVTSWYAVLLAAIVAATAMLSTSELRAAPAANPAEVFVQENVDRAFVILNNAELSEEQRYMGFRELILSLMDARRIGMFTLGPYANRASPAEIESFIAAFSDYTIRFIYGAGFAQIIRIEWPGVKLRQRQRMPKRID